MIKITGNSGERLTPDRDNSNLKHLMLSSIANAKSLSYAEPILDISSLFSTVKSFQVASLRLCSRANCKYSSSSGISRNCSDRWNYEIYITSRQNSF